MNIVLIIIAVLVVAAGVYYFGFYKRGKINDVDGDFIPDEVEDAYEKAEDFVEEAVKDGKELLDDAKAKAKQIKKTYKAVKEELQDVIEEVKDVGSAFKGKATKTNLRKLTKKELSSILNIVMFYLLIILYYSILFK